MAQKKTYIYRILIGHKDNILVDIFMYARNSKVAVEYCKEKYREEKYDYYKAVKVGISHTLKDTEIVDDYTAVKLKHSIAAQDVKFAERNMEFSVSKNKLETGDS